MVHAAMLGVEVALASLLAAACDAPSEPEARADIRPGAAQAAGVHGGPDVRLINMKDACDPASFGAVGVDCLRNGGFLFDKFIGKHGIMRAWHFAPSGVHAKVGQTLMAVNRGGKVHTFTEVEEFGGGIVPILNTLSGNSEVAPECLALKADDFIQPGSFDADDEVEEPGTEHYQCCIHPWMRATVIANSALLVPAKAQEDSVVAGRRHIGESPVTVAIAITCSNAQATVTYVSKLKSIVKGIPRRSGGSAQTEDAPRARGGYACAGDRARTSSRVLDRDSIPDSHCLSQAAAVIGGVAP